MLAINTSTHEELVIIEGFGGGMGERRGCSCFSTSDHTSMWALAFQHGHPRDYVGTQAKEWALTLTGLGGGKKEGKGALLA